jgi:hypothetical protein
MVSDSFMRARFSCWHRRLADVPHQQLARADLGVAGDAAHQLERKGQGFEGVGFFAGQGLLWCESVMLDTKVP